MAVGSLPTARHPRARPEGSSLDDLVPEIEPIGIALLDQRLLPLAIPTLKHLFALDGDDDVIVYL